MMYNGRTYSNRGDNAAFCSRNEGARVHVQQVLMQRQGQAGRGGGGSHSQQQQR